MAKERKRMRRKFDGRTVGVRTAELIAAALTVTKRTPPARARCIRRRLGSLLKGKVDPRVAATLYYLQLGTVPRPLWET